MRPRGEIANALSAAAKSGPGTVADMCRRAQVGMAAGRYTASRMLDRGELVVLEAGRPAVVVAAEVAADWRPESQGVDANYLQHLDAFFSELAR